MARYANRLQELNDHGYLYCTLFAQYGGFESNISSSQFGASGCFRTYPAALPAFRFFEISEVAISDNFGFFFYKPAETAPRFLASILVELFRRLQAAALLGEGAQTEDPYSSQLLEVLSSLEGALKRWQTALLESAGRLTKDRCWFRWGIRFVNQRFANVICAIPQADAKKRGVADWFVRQTKTNIFDAVTSSTKIFLDLQSDSTCRECLCMEFMNVLAALSHCGFATETVSSMFESCMGRIVGDRKSDNLGPYEDCGVQLPQVLSVLAKARRDMFRGPSEAPKYHLLKEILDTCRENHKCREGAAFSARHTLENILLHGFLDFFPAEGFSPSEMWSINNFQNELLDHITPLCGESVFEHPYGESPWPADEVRALMRVKTSHYFSLRLPWRFRSNEMPLSDRIAKSQPEISATRKGWVKKLLDGTTRYLRLQSTPVVSEHSNPGDPSGEALFPDEDIEDIRLACQEYPVLRDTLEEFLDELLELRASAEGGDD